MRAHKFHYGDIQAEGDRDQDMSLQPESFDISDPLNRFLNNWIWLLASAVLGVIVGLIFSMFFPARYEAGSSFAVNIVYGVVDQLELVVEDRVLDRVWQLATSDETFHEAKAILDGTVGTLDEWNSVETLRKHTRLDARLSRWELIGIHTDPAIAVEIANTWRTVTLNRLDEAYKHAWNAYSIQDIAFDVECVHLLAAQSTDRLWTCVNTGPGVSPESIQLFRDELDASRGILPILHYEPIQLATLPENPVLWPRGLMMFFAGTIGIIVGGFLILLKPNYLDRNAIAENIDPKSK